MQRGGRDNDLISFLEFCNSTSDLQVDLNFPDDVLADAQGDPPLQNDNRNLIQNQNPNPSLLNQNQEQGLFEGMHIHPNFNNLMEPRYQPYYQLNPELRMHSNQNYTAIPPCPHANVTNVASISRGETYISRSSRRRRHGTIMNRPTYNGTGNSASEPMQQNIEGFVRITRMRADPGQPMSNPDLASNTLLIPLARINTTLLQPVSCRALASNALSIPLARPNPNPGQLITLAFNPLSIPSPNLSPMQIIPETAPAISGRVTSQSWSVALPSSDHELAQFRAMVPELAGLTNQRTTSHQQPVRVIASSDAHQLRRTRSQPYEVYQPHQAVPVSTIPSVPASSALSVSVPDHTASTSQTGNSGVCFFFLPSEERPSYLPPIRIRFPIGTSSIVALEIQARLNREIMVY